MTINQAIIESDNGKRVPVCEYFHSLQGEGYHTGRAVFFIRLSGCNVGCVWCDTKESWSVKESDFKDIDTIIDIVSKFNIDCVVITGGEPTLYNLEPLIDALHGNGIEVNIETSGSGGVISKKIDWVTISPKQQKEVISENYHLANELKIVIEKESDFIYAEKCRENVNENCICYLQPQWGNKEFLNNIIEYIKHTRGWKLSLQTHKYLNIE